MSAERRPTFESRLGEELNPAARAEAAETRVAALEEALRLCDAEAVEVFEHHMDEDETHSFGNLVHVHRRCVAALAPPETPGEEPKR